MHLLQHSLLVLGLFFIKTSFAQELVIPKITSQYLGQENDPSGILLTIQYQDQKAFWDLEGTRLDFTQKNLYQYLDKQFEGQTREAIQQKNIKLEATKDMPVSYLQDTYAWLQIYGNEKLHLAIYESMVPNQKQYINLDILPFTQLEKACDYYATTIEGGHTAIGAFSLIHQNTDYLTTEKQLNTSLDVNKTYPKYYIPQNILHVEVLSDNQILFKGRPANPMVLASLIQAELVANYNNNYDKASPQQYLWLNLNMNQRVSYQQYTTVLVALQEAFHLYWEELAFNKFQKSYLELDIQQRWTIQQTSPPLIAQYNALELLYIQDKLSGGEPKKWSDL